MSSRKSAPRRHLALHATLLGVARWRLDAGATDAPMPQAAWQAASQQHFMDWLAAGGFAREDGRNENSGCDAAVLMSHCGTQCEELNSL